MICGYSTHVVVLSAVLVLFVPAMASVVSESDKARIVALASSEPTYLGVDSLLRLSDLLDPVDSDMARTIVKEIALRARQQPLMSAATANRIVSAVARIDSVEAEHLALHLFAASQDTAYRDSILDLALVKASRGDMKRAARFLELSLKAGACCLSDSSWVLRSLALTDDRRMRVISTQIVDHFRPETATEWNVLMLLDCTRVFISNNVNVTEKALEKAIDATQRISPNSTLVAAEFRVRSEKIGTADTRSSLLFQIACLSAAFSPNQYQRHLALFDPWRKDLSALTPAEAIKAAKPTRLVFSQAEAARWQSEAQRKLFHDVKDRISGMSVMDSRKTLDKVQDLDVRVPALLELASQLGPFSEDQKSIAIGTLPLIAKMTPGINQLRSLSAETAALLQSARDSVISECLVEFARSAFSYCGQRTVTPSGEQQCEEAYSFLAVRAFSGQPDSSVLQTSNDPSVKARVLIKKLEQALSRR